MTAQRDIRTAIANRLEQITAPEIGVVTDHRVIYTSQDRIGEIFGYRLTTQSPDWPKHTRGIQVTLSGDDPGFFVPGTTEDLWWVNTWSLEGYLQIVDGGHSELEVHDLANAVRDAMEDESWMSGLPDMRLRREDLYGPAISEFATVLFGATLCHMYTIIFQTVDELAEA